MEETPSNDYPVLAPHGWMSTFPAFRETPALYIRDRLSAFLPDASAEQLRAWDESISPLQREVGEVLERDDGAHSYGTILEYQLPLNHRRPDALLLMGGSVIVIEAKGKERPSQADLDQVSAYARDLGAYHELCDGRPVHPVLLLTRARGRLGRQAGVEVIGPDALHGLLNDLDEPLGAPQIQPVDFLGVEHYRPLPALVRAARELFETGELRRIRRAAAATDPAVEVLSRTAHEAARLKRRHLVLVTGSPGTGKTLVGLQFVHSRFLDDLAVRRADGSLHVPAVFLSGNGPLVEVLQYELSNAGGGGRTFVRDVKSYVERYLRSPQLVPDEHVVVFDEAQRAWDAAKVAREHKGPNATGSEPDHFLEFGARIPDWCVIVGLVGSGQEIHDGEEAGLGQWRAALDRLPEADDWTVTVPPTAATAFEGIENLTIEPALQLAIELRYHSAQAVHSFAEGLLSLQPVGELRELATQLETDAFHLRATRDLDVAKRYLRDRYTDNPDARFGVLASSRDVDLPRFGVNNDWNATKRVRPGPWFCDGEDDPFGRSCRTLRECVTEFGCQGLELDAALVAWGTDFLLEDGRWTNRRARRYQSPHLIRDAFQLRLNAYRVLLTRGRDATVVFVPPMPALDPVWELLLASGFRELHGHGPAGLGADVRGPDLDESSELLDLIGQVRETSGLRRIELRDPIATFGAEALGPLVALANDGFAAFAAQTIKKIGELGAKYEAAAALGSIDRERLAPGVRSDLEAAIAVLAPRRASVPRSLPAGVEGAVGRLEIGKRYRRVDLHSVGLGGNRQKGISYPASGEHVLLFSGGTGRTDFGYEDQWRDGERYEYFGEWNGPGDMNMTGGNAAIRDRSPELFLFVERQSGQHEFLGRFEFVDMERRQAVRDGRESSAIVFVLRKVADVVELGTVL
jgi:hypothetical protein